MLGEVRALAVLMRESLVLLDYAVLPAGTSSFCAQRNPALAMLGEARALAVLKREILVLLDYALRALAARF